MDNGEETQGEVTRWLSAAHGGDEEALQRLLAHVYDELRAMAHGMMAREGGGATLEATALVHELWLKLERQESVGFKHRAQFFGAAAQMMRRILVDHARRRSRKKSSDELLEGPIDQLIQALEARSGGFARVGTSARNPREE